MPDNLSTLNSRQLSAYRELVAQQPGMHLDVPQSKFLHYASPHINYEYP